MKPSGRQRIIFRIVILGCVAAVSGVFLLGFAISQLNKIIRAPAAVHTVISTQAENGLSGWLSRLDWTMIVVVGCGSISLTCLIAITQNVISLVRTAAAAVPAQGDEQTH